MVLLRAKKLSWIALASAALLPSPLLAQSASLAPGSARSWSKNDAILGGAPSALQAILAQQGGLPRPIATPVPASYSTPAFRALGTDLGMIRPAISKDRPDVFGSVALKVRRAPLMARWQKAEKARLVGASARYAEALGDLGEVDRLEAVNRYVNDRVAFTEDRRQFGQADVWTSAAETLTRGRGDCEDYAIAKMQMLRRAGFADRDLYLVIVKDLVSRGDHAVLVVRAGDRMHVLDNGTSKLLDSEEIRDYRPILTFAASGGAWTHGYRVRPAPLEDAPAEEMAAASIAAAPDQRSLNASLLAFNTGFSK